MKQSIRIIVEKISYQQLSECRGRRAGDEQFVLIGKMQVCAAGEGGERCAEPGAVRWCQAV